MSCGCPRVQHYSKLDMWICGLPRFSALLPTINADSEQSTNTQVYGDDPHHDMENEVIAVGAWQAVAAAHDLKKDGKTVLGKDQSTTSVIGHAPEITDAGKYVHMQTYDPLYALLTHRQSPVSSCSTDEEKIAWLRSQLIGERLEFVTPFGRRHLIYADHTASGRSLFFVEDFIMRYVLPFYGNTHTDDSYVGVRTSEMVKQAEEYIKKQLGGTSEDLLIMCGWGCTGAIKRLQEVMGIAAPSTLRARIIDAMFTSSDDEGERWLVFTGPYEHHSNLLSWRQSLAEVVEIPADEDGFIDTQALEANLKAPHYSRRRWKIGAFSATSNVTGLLTDTRTLACLLHRHGAFACFDFAAGAPHLKIDMRSGHEDGYDAVVLSPHKLLGGPGTPGLLLMRKSLYKLDGNPPSTCGGGTVAYVNGFNEEDTLYREGIEEREDSGTPAIVGKVRCALAFWVKEMIGAPIIWQRESFFLNMAVGRLSSHPGIQILGGRPPPYRAPIISFLVNVTSTNIKDDTMRKRADHIQANGGKPLHGRFVVKLLNDLFGIQARGGCACAGPYGHLLLNVSEEVSLAIRSAIQKGHEGLKPGWTRLSLCYTMTEEDVDYILSAIEFVAEYGQRFLALYDFDWCSGNWILMRGSTHQGNCSEIGKLHVGWGGKVAVLPNGKKNESQWMRFRKYLRLAKALAHRLPKCPPLRTVPSDIDPHLLLFCV